MLMVYVLWKNLTTNIALLVHIVWKSHAYSPVLFGNVLFEIQTNNLELMVHILW